MGRYALLIAAGEYEDHTLARLRAPHQDVDRLAAILEAPEVGGFTSVTVLQDTVDYQLRMAIEEMLTERMRDDLVLVYFSCHGIVDGQHRLYFATTNTRHTRPAGTAVSRTFVNEQLEACVASARVLILDCCYSGAFAEGFKSAPKSALEGQVGRGYVVLAASDAYEYAYEADSVTDAAPRASVFTDVLIEGLSSGAADLDGDHRIGVDELFRYVQEGVRRRSPNQTPRFWANDAELNIYLATAGQPESAATATSTVRPARDASTGEVGLAVRPSNYNRNQVIVARGLRVASDRIRLCSGHWAGISWSRTRTVTTLRRTTPIRSPPGSARRIHGIGSVLATRRRSSNRHTDKSGTELRRLSCWPRPWWTARPPLFGPVHNRWHWPAESPSASPGRSKRWRPGPRPGD